MRRALILWACCGAAGFAQRLDPVVWSMSIDPAAAPPGGKALATITAKIEPGWHVYSMSTPKPPLATSGQFLDNPLTQTTRFYQGQPKRAFDPYFGAETETFEEKAVFLAEITLKSDAPK